MASRISCTLPQYGTFSVDGISNTARTRSSRLARRSASTKPRTVLTSRPNTCPTTSSGSTSGRSPPGRRTSVAEDGTDGPRETATNVSTTAAIETTPARPISDRTRRTPRREATTTLLEVEDSLYGASSERLSVRGENYELRDNHPSCRNH